MTTTILIPARYASTRYPGKPLANLTGPDGTKTLIQRSWEAAMSVPEADNVFVATDDDRIAETARRFGAEVIMTSEACRNGTERCADALTRHRITPNIVVNLQGDAPLTPTWFLSDLIKAMEADKTLDVATPVLRCDPETLAMFVEDRASNRVGGTTVVFDNQGRGLYFSKEVIPYTGGKNFAQNNVPVFHHVGIYAYRPAVLASYIGWPEGRMEQLEGLEQLRFLENNAHVKCVEVDARGRLFWELNNPEDIVRIEQVLNRENPL